MNRREFLRTSTVIAALGATAPNSWGAAPAGTGRKMKIALTPGSVGVSVKSQLELNALAQRHGFEAVEPRGDEIAALSAGQAGELVADLKAKGLVWAAAGLPVDFRKDDRTFQEGLAKLPKIAAGLQRAGATRMGTWLQPSHESLTYSQNFKQHAKRLREVAKPLQDAGIRLGLEYVGTQLLLVGKRYPFVHTMAEDRELIAEIGVGNVGLVLDTWHWWCAGDTTADILALNNRDVVTVDLNDAPKGVAKEQQKDNERELPGATGVIDLAAFLGALQQVGYDGPARAEPFNRTLNALDNEPACAAVSAAMHRAMDLVA
jgi:sugar phosphate isomerase/epimerase